MFSIITHFIININNCEQISDNYTKYKQVMLIKKVQRETILSVYIDI